MHKSMVLKSMFDFHVINSDDAVPVNLTAVQQMDVFSWINWGELDSFLRQSTETKPKVPDAWIENRGEDLLMFDNKIQWKEYMKSIGLHKYIPESFTIDTATFPCMLKTAAHFGSGVHVVQNMSHLQQFISDLKHTSYMLEESLMGMGLSEGAAYGSVYKGEVISLRCIVRNHSAHSLQLGGIFVRGLNNLKSTSYYSPCGVETLSVLNRVFAPPVNYTGPFCADLKANANGDIKFLEINARMCGSMPYSDALFLETYIPLAFAIARDVHSKDTPKWFTEKGRISEVYHRVSHHLIEEIPKKKSFVFTNKAPDVSYFDTWKNPGKRRKKGARGENR